MGTKAALAAALISPHSVAAAETYFCLLYTSFAGEADNPAQQAECAKAQRELGLTNQVTWLGVVSEEQKCEWYANSLGVVFPPLDEDYGYVTLEAMLSSKPVITCADSGGPLEFVVPVSYTHLDVYKRQRIDREVARLRAQQTVQEERIARFIHCLLYTSRCV